MSYVSYVECKGGDSNAGCRKGYLYTESWLELDKQEHNKASVARPDKLRGSYEEIKTFGIKYLANQT